MLTGQQCKTILMVIATGHIIGGLLLPVIVHTPVFAGYQQHLINVLAITNPGSVEGIQFLVAILGPTIASWGILFFAAVKHAFARPTPESWWTIAIASSIWAIYDSCLSLYYGVFWNAGLNLIVFICIMIPLLTVKRLFFNTVDQ